MNFFIVKDAGHILGYIDDSSPDDDLWTGEQGIIKMIESKINKLLFLGVYWRMYPVRLSRSNLIADWVLPYG